MTHDPVQEDIAALPTDDPADGSILSERGFLMAAEGTVHRARPTPARRRHQWPYLARRKHPCFSGALGGLLQALRYRAFKGLLG